MVRDSYYEFDRDWCLQSIGNFMGIGTNTALPRAYCSDCITQALLTSMGPASPIDMSINPRYMAIFSMVPPPVGHTAVGVLIGIRARSPD